MDSNFGLRAEDAAPRSFAPRDSGRPNRVRTRREVRLAGPALCPLRCNPAEELIRASTNRPAPSALSQHAVTLPASRFASHSIAPQAAIASPGTASAPSLVLPTSSEICPRAHERESEAKRGEAFWSCPLPVAQQPRRRADPSLNRHSHASLQSTCQPRALHMTRTASRPARACLGTAQHLFSRCFRPARNWAPGQAYWNEDGIFSGHTSPIRQIMSGHQPVLPRIHGPRANLRQEPCPSSRDIIGLRKLVQLGLL